MNAFYFGTVAGAACATAACCLTGRQLEGAVALMVVDWLLRKAGA